MPNEMSDDRLGFDFVVIGAGIAGASVAAELSVAASVVLLEAESQPGYHSTGRSAAMYVPAYGPPAIRALTRASGPFFHAPPDGFAETALLCQRDILMVARADQRGATADCGAHGLAQLWVDHGTALFHIAANPNDGCLSITLRRVGQHPHRIVRELFAQFPTHVKQRR